MNRSVAFRAFNDSLSAEYDAGTFQIFGELGYKIRPEGCARTVRQFVLCAIEN